MSTLSGWKQATNYVGHGTSTMRIRRAVVRGELRATKTGNAYTFDTDDLDAFKASLTATAGGIVAPSKAPAQLATPPATGSSTSAIATASAPNGVIAPFLLAAVAARDSARVGSAAAGTDDREDNGTVGDETSYQPPFWAVSAAPMYPEGEPVVDPATLMISYRPTGSNGLPNHPPGTLGAFVAELQAQLATTQAQLAAATTAWRRERVSAIAADIAVEAITGGAMLQVVPAVRDAAHAAVAALPDTQLCRDDGYAVAVARGAAMAAAQQIGAAIASAWQAQWPSPGDPRDDLSRARARRRSRAPRW